MFSNWQKVVGKVILYGPAAVKLIMDAFEVTNPDVMTWVSAAVAILTTLIGLVGPKKQATTATAAKVVK